MASIANLARQESLIVIATIHQPGYDTLVSFDRIAMLAGGIKCFDGTLQELDLILHQLNIQVPDYVSVSLCAVPRICSNIAPYRYFRRTWQ